MLVAGFHYQLGSSGKNTRAATWVGGIAAFLFGTPFAAVRALALHALAATAGAEIPLPDLLKIAEIAFVRAVGKRVDRDQKQDAADIQSRLLILKVGGY